MLKDFLGLNNESMDFREICKRRIGKTIILMALGLVVFAISLICYKRLGDIGGSGLQGFYSGLGAGLVAGGAVKLFRNRRYLKDEKLGRARQVYELDERIRLMSLRSWSYAGCTMFFLLYLGVVAAGFFNVIVMETLLAVMVVFLIVFLAFSCYLKRVM